MTAGAITTWTISIPKERVLLTLVGAFALLFTDHPRRAVPSFWQAGLSAGEAGQFVIRKHGDLTLKFVSARLGAGGLEIVPVPFYQDKGPGTRSVAEIARRFSQETRRPVLAAINGGFFDIASGLPIGFLLRDGRMEFFNMPQGFQRSMVGFGSAAFPGRGARVWISSPDRMPKVWLDAFMAGATQPLRTASIAVHHINVPGGKQAFSLFTPTYGQAIKVPERAVYGIAHAEAGREGVYRVVATYSSGRVRIPSRGLVIALHGGARSHARWLVPGTLVRPRWTLPPDWHAGGVIHGLLAGPRLLAAGKIQVTARQERLEAVRGRDRVALAVKPDGDALLVLLHKHSPGNLTFERVAAVLAEMGASEAIALDGGKSRAILAELRGGAYAQDRYFDGGRPVSNALVLAGPSSRRRNL